MLQAETQSDLQGFGNGKLPGELYYSLNMTPTPFGFAPFYKNTVNANSNTVVGMQLFRWLVEYNGSTWGVDDGNHVLSRQTGSWAIERSLAVTGSGNGMIVDQTGRLLVVNSRYLTKLVSLTWTESWQDLGSSVTGDKGMDTYLDWVVIPHGNKVALLNTTDDSFNSAGLTFPTGCTCTIAKSSRTGVLLGVNMGNRSFVALWDAQSDRSIAEWIWSDQPIKSICRSGDAEWIVTTTREIFRTNGYVKVALPSIPDPLIGQDLYNPVAGGTMVVNNLFYLMHTDNAINYARRKSGLYILDMTAQLWRFVAPADLAVQNVTMGAILSDSTSSIWNAHRNSGTSTYSIAKLTNDIPTSAYFITAPFGLTANTQKIAEGAKVELVSNNQVQSYAPMTFDMAVKVYDYSRPLWAYGTVAGTAGALNLLPVSGTQSGYNNAAVGDEVTFLSGNNAGSVRHIIAISSKDTVNEVWTLDSNLPNLAGGAAIFNVSPFKLAQKFTVSSADSIPVQGLYFNIQNRFRGKRFLIKVLFENMSSVNLSVSATTFIHNDLGLI